MKNREQAHSAKRQYRRQCEREGLVTKSGRQWRKFRKMMQRLAKEYPLNIEAAVKETAEEMALVESVKKGIEDIKAGRSTLIDPETLVTDEPVTEEMLKGIEEARENLGTELSDADLREDGINDGLVDL